MSGLSPQTVTLTATPYGTALPTPVVATASSGFVEWLAQQGAALAVSDPRRNLVVLIGTHAGQLTLSASFWDRPFALGSTKTSMWVASRHQLWRLGSFLEEGERDLGSDRLFVPLEGKAVGAIDVRELCFGANSEPSLVSTALSCIARASHAEAQSLLEVEWLPPFVSRLAAEERCLLTGAAAHNGAVRYATVGARSDGARSWVHERLEGGVVLDVTSGEVVGRGLSLPHSPRLRGDQLWLLEGGRGLLGTLDGDGAFSERTRLGGFARGLRLLNDHAVVGSSKLVEPWMKGLPVDERLAAAARRPKCAVSILDLDRGEIESELEFVGGVEQISDLIVLEGCSNPAIVGFAARDVRAICSVADRDGLRMARHRHATTARLGHDPLGPRDWPGSAAERPRARTLASLAEIDPAKLPRRNEWNRERRADTRSDARSSTWSEAVFEAPSRALAETYSALTFPDFRQRLATRKTASVQVVAALTKTPVHVAPGPASQLAPGGGDSEATAALDLPEAEEVVGLSLSEWRPDERTGEVLSFWVHPEHREQGTGSQLVELTERALRERGAERIGGMLHSTWTHCQQMERLLVRAGWSEPQARQVTCRFDMEEFLKIETPPQLQLPEGFEIVPFVALTDGQRAGILRRHEHAQAQGGRWYPPQLDPFQLEGSQFQHGPSTALLLKGEVAGWLTTHVLSPTTLQYTALFVDPGLRMQYLALQLVGITFLRQKDDYVRVRPKGLRWATFMTDADNEATMRWMDSHVREFKPRITERRWSEKPLVPDQPS